MNRIQPNFTIVQHHDLETTRRTSTMRRIWGSKPMSSMRSASSSTRNWMQHREMRPRWMRSTSRPGVATRRSHPRSSSRNLNRHAVFPQALQVTRRRGRDGQERPQKREVCEPVADADRYANMNHDLLGMQRAGLMSDDMRERHSYGYPCPRQMPH